MKIGSKHTEETRRKMSVWQSSKRLSAIHKKRIGLASKGRRHSKAVKALLSKLAKARTGTRNAFYGHHHTDANKAHYSRLFTGTKRSAAFRRNRRLKMLGPLNPNWTGKYPEHLRERCSLRYRRWRARVFKRDGYACVLCGDSRGGNLEADHIKPFSTHVSLRYRTANGRTLCVSCHKQTPTYGAKARSRAT